MECIAFRKSADIKLDFAASAQPGQRIELRDLLQLVIRLVKISISQSMKAPNDNADHHKRADGDLNRLLEITQELQGEDRSGNHAKRASIGAQANHRKPENGAQLEFRCAILERSPGITRIMRSGESPKGSTSQ
jgi:hypothetical protein